MKPSSLKGLQWPELGWMKANSQELLSGYPMLVQGPKHINQQLDHHWSSQDLNRCSYGILTLQAETLSTTPLTPCINLEKKSEHINIKVLTQEKGKTQECV